MPPSVLLNRESRYSSQDYLAIKTLLLTVNIPKTTRTRKEAITVYADKPRYGYRRAFLVIIAVR